MSDVTAEPDASGAAPAVADAKIHERAALGEEILRVDNLFKHFPIMAGI